jgi:hypothetical protein
MHENADPQSKSPPNHGDRSDKQAFAQVERWMAIIREISRERQGPVVFRG